MAINKHYEQLERNVGNYRRNEVPLIKKRNLQGIDEKNKRNSKLVFEQIKNRVNTKYLDYPQAKLKYRYEDHVDDRDIDTAKESYDMYVRQINETPDRPNMGPPIEFYVNHYKRRILNGGCHYCK